MKFKKQINNKIYKINHMMIYKQNYANVKIFVINKSKN